MVAIILSIFFSFFTEINHYNDAQKQLSFAPQMITINAGSVKSIKIKYDFEISKYEITQAEFEAVMGYNPSFFKNDDFPVDNVTWREAWAFCNKLNILEGYEPFYFTSDGRLLNINGDTLKNINQLKGYRLPTNDEWEYAARAGNRTKFNTGSILKLSQANFSVEAPKFLRQIKTVNSTTTVGSYKPNKWGLYDTHGNVAEWSNDFLIKIKKRNYIYIDSVKTYNDSINFIDTFIFPGNYALRGGSWANNEKLCELSYKMKPASASRYSSNKFGFRIARSL